MVIDVLRATSVMPTALMAGAASIITCREVDEAIGLVRATLPRPLLCGERECRPIEGFDLGNSPAEYSSAAVAGRTLVMTTTNGTRAIDAVTEAPRVITASFLNLSAVVNQLSGADRVHLVCAGTNGQITGEDVLLAGAVLCQCQLVHRAKCVDDESAIAQALWSSWGSADHADGLPSRAQLSGKLRETQGGRNLVAVGYAKDLERCAAIDSVPVVPTRMALSPPTFSLEAPSAGSVPIIARS